MGEAHHSTNPKGNSDIMSEISIQAPPILPPDWRWKEDDSKWKRLEIYLMELRKAIQKIALNTLRDSVRQYVVISGIAFSATPHTVTAGEAASGVLTVAAYVMGTHTLFMFRNGQYQTVGVDYNETSTTSVTFVAGVLTEGDSMSYIALTGNIT